MIHEPISLVKTLGSFPVVRCWRTRCPVSPHVPLRAHVHPCGKENWSGGGKPALQRGWITPHSTAARGLTLHSDLQSTSTSTILFAPHKNCERYQHEYHFTVTDWNSAPSCHSLRRSSDLRSYRQDRSPDPGSGGGDGTRALQESQQGPGQQRSEETQVGGPRGETLGRVSKA